MEILESRILCSTSLLQTPTNGPQSGIHVSAIAAHAVSRTPAHTSKDHAKNTAKPNTSTTPLVALTINPSSLLAITAAPTNVASTAAGASPTVAGHYIYYGGTAYFGDVLASDKSVLLPTATATAANVTSFAGGINEIVLDVANAAATYAASDFTFRVGTTGDPYSWGNAPAPTSITVSAGAGVGGSSRVYVRWSDGAIANQWLQVIFAPAADTFYVGNLVGSTDSFQVTAATETAARSNTTSFLAPASITNTYDFNRDGRVDATDQLIARAANGAALPVLSAPAVPVAPASYDWHTQTINGALNIWAPNPGDFGATFTVTDPTMLFGSDGVPQIEGVHQGPIADCYFLSAAGSLAYENPARIEALVKNDAGGGWAVTFQYLNSSTGLYSPVVIHTNNQLSSSLQNVSNNEVWSLVLEKAYAAFRTWNGISSTNTMASIGWGYPGSAFSGLSDNNASVYIGGMTQQGFYSTLQNDLAAGLPITYQTSASAPTMIQSHVYVITAVSTDASGNRWITTYNPWGFYDVRSESDLLANGIGTIVVGTH